MQLKDAADCTTLLATAARARQLLARLLATTLEAAPPVVPPPAAAGVLPAGLQAIMEEQSAGCGGTSDDLRMLIVELYDLENETEYTLTIATEGEIQERGEGCLSCSHLICLLLAEKQARRGVQVTPWLW